MTKKCSTILKIWLCFFLMKCTLKPQLHLGWGRTFLVFYRSSGMFDDPCNSLVNTWLALLLTQNGLMGAGWMDAWFCCKSSCDSIRKKAWSIDYTTSLSPIWKVKHHQEGSQFCFNKRDHSQFLMEVVISVKTNEVLTYLGQLPISQLFFAY